MPRNSRDHRITAWIAMRPSYLHQKSCITIDLSRRMLWTVCFSRNTMTKKMLKVNWDCHLGLGHRPCYLGHATRAPRPAGMGHLLLGRLTGLTWPVGQAKNIIFCPSFGLDLFLGLEFVTDFFQELNLKCFFPASRRKKQGAKW